MAGTFTNLNYHLVFSTKNRVPYINNSTFEERLHAYLGGCVRGQGGIAYKINGTADHVHLLIRWKPNADISGLMCEIKSESSKWVHAHFPDLRQFKWQEGYGAFSVSFSQIDIVKNYIAQQKEHHHGRSFQDEFRKMLNAHKIAYDEKTIWL